MAPKPWTNEHKQISQSSSQQPRRSSRLNRSQSISTVASGQTRVSDLGLTRTELARLLSMSTSASSKHASQEPATPNPAEAEAPLPPPDLNALASGETSAADQNMIVLNWLRSRGYDTAKRFEEEIRSGRAGSDPIVLVNDPGSGSDGEGKDAAADSAKGQMKRRSSRLARQQPKETISMQELASRAAPKGTSTAAEKAVAATPTTASSSKKTARGASPVAQTHPAFLNRRPGSKPSVTISTSQSKRTPTPPPSAVPAAQDFSTLQALMAQLVKATAPMTAEESQKLTANLTATMARAGMTLDEALARDPTDKQRGYKDLENWVDGALDMYRVSVTRRLLETLLKLFCVQ